MTVSTLALLEPVVALVVDAIGERDVVLSARSYAGVAVTIGGVGLSLLGGGTKAAEIVSDGART
jgi:hypothetical protein